MKIMKLTKKLKSLLDSWNDKKDDIKELDNILDKLIEKKEKIQKKIHSEKDKKELLHLKDKLSAVNKLINKAEKNLI